MASRLAHAVSPIYADGGASLMNPEVPPEIQLG
jgi:hypothetical protein